MAVSAGAEAPAGRPRRVRRGLEALSRTPRPAQPRHSGRRKTPATGCPATTAGRCATAKPKAAPSGIRRTHLKHGPPHVSCARWAESSALVGPHPAGAGTPAQNTGHGPQEIGRRDTPRTAPQRPRHHRRVYCQKAGQVPYRARLLTPSRAPRKLLGSRVTASITPVDSSGTPPPARSSRSPSRGTAEPSSTTCRINPAGSNSGYPVYHLTQSHICVPHHALRG